MSEKDLEYEELKKVRQSLIEKVNELQRKIQLKEKNGTEIRRYEVENFTNSFNGSTGKKNSNLSNKNLAKIVKASELTVGVRFKDIKKNWIGENLYRYDADIVTKAVKYAIQLTVDAADPGKHQIQDLKCKFLDVEDTFVPEITPWMQRFTNDKQFSYLITAISEYSEQSVIRAKILNSLEASGHGRTEENEDDSGGVLVCVHPKDAPDQEYFMFQWQIKFIDKTWGMEHIFAIDQIQADEEFMKANDELIRSFCRVGLRQKDLKELWTNLLEAVDSHKE